MENKKLTKEEMNVFRTTTGRVVGILLDLDKKTLQFWLNGKEQTGRAKTLTEGYWLPAIRIAGIDNCVILNPYGLHPSFTVPYACYNSAQSGDLLKQDMEQYLDSWVLVSQLRNDVSPAPSVAYVKAQIPSDVELLDAIVPEDKTHKAMGWALARVGDVARFLKDCEAVNPKPTVLDSAGMAALLLGSEKTPQLDMLIRCLRTREEQARAKLGEVVNGSELTVEKISAQMNGIMKSEESFEEVIKHCEYLPYTDKLLLTGKTTLKLVSREDDEKVGFAGKSGSSAAMRLGSAPRSAHEKIKLHMNRLEAQQLSHKLDWTEIFDTNAAPISDYLLYFVTAMSSALNEGKLDDIFMEIPYGVGKKAVDAVMRNLLQAMSEEEGDAGFKEGVLKRIAAGASSLAKGEPKPGEKQKHLSLEDLHLLLSIILKLDEQLWCLTSADDVGDDVRALWDIRTSRIHTAYGRLSSFVTWPTPGSIALAEAGLCNIGDKKIVLQHFMEPGIEVENALKYDQKTRGEVWTLLERDFPNNRMLRGEPCANVPLSVTLRYLPSVRHTNLEMESQEITHTEHKSDSQFVMTGSADGSVNVWNARLRLFKVLSTNFKMRLEAKVKPTALRIEEQESGLLMNLFDEEAVAVNEPSEEIQLPTEEKPKTEEKKPEEVKKVVQPKQELLDQIVAMGFPIELAKKALIAVNNEGLEQAMDALLELQKKELPRAEEKKQEPVDLVIMSWACPKCTLINVEGKKVCEVCNEPAPPSAFKSTKPIVEEKKLPLATVPEKDAERVLKEEEEKKTREKDQKKIEEERKLIEAAKVCGYTMVVHNEYPETPFTIVCALSHEHGSFLRIRRFKYATKYLQSFVTPVTNKGWMSQITDLWINSTDDMDVKQHLFGDCRDIVETYAPLFVRNQHRDGWVLEKTKLSGTNIVPRDELDLQLQYAEICSICSITKPGEKEDNHMLLILAKKAATETCPLTLIKVSLSSAFGKDPKLTAKVVGELQLSGHGPAKLLCDGLNLVAIVTKEESSVVDVGKMEVRDLLHESCDINNVHMLAEGGEGWTCAEINKIASSTTMQINNAKNNRRFALAFITRGMVKRYWLTPKEPGEEKTEKGAIASGPIELKSDFPEIV